MSDKTYFDRVACPVTAKLAEHRDNMPAEVSIEAEGARVTVSRVRVEGDVDYSLEPRGSGKGPQRYRVTIEGWVLPGGSNDDASD